LVNNQPCPKRKGQTYRRWIRELEALGYVIEWRELRGCDYGAPTIRKRWFMVARCDGLPIVWPTPTHGAPDSLPVKAGKLLPWRTAAECIDWSIPCPSIFEREEAAGRGDAAADRQGRDAVRGERAEPFIVPLTHQGGDRVEPLDQSRSARHGANRGERALVQRRAGALPDRARERQHPAQLRADEPLRTQVAQVKGGHFALVSAFLAKHYGGVVGSDLQDPIGTVTSVGPPQPGHQPRGEAARHQQGRPAGRRAAAHGQRAGPAPRRGARLPGQVLRRDQDPRLEEPLHTVTTKDRFGLVMVHGEPYAIVDIGMRMLTPRELYRAQGFPETTSSTAAPTASR
jgi:DNA (cytosine-5)-methyltransferase 1